MVLDPDSARFEAARQDFRRARQRAALERVVAQLRGEPGELLSYDEVHRRLKLEGAVERGLQEIPLEAIVGSVGRYSDFTRTFLPRREGMEERWARVRALIESGEDLPPINVYQVGDAYFVLDGNHRVSVARAMNLKKLPAYVTEIPTPVALSPETDADALIIADRQADFLLETRLDESRPDASLTVTAPGQYRHLAAEIEQHRQHLQERREETVTIPEAAADWYDRRYRPVADIIRRRRILRHFPGRTETDLYVWLSRHREEVEAELGWTVATEAAATDLITRFGSSRPQVLARVKDRLLEAITPDPLASGPQPGEWRKEAVLPREEGPLFANVLVPLTGKQAGWRALGQALVIARREQGEVRGLHVQQAPGQPEEEEAVADRFRQSLASAGVGGEIAFEQGPVARTICDRAWWNDLVVLALSHPPGSRPGDRLTSGMSAVLRSCGRPVLTVPGKPVPLARPLLAYDGSPKAKEALFVATYIAARWEVPLVVLAVGEAERQAEEVIDQARLYLIARGVSATYVTRDGNVTSAIAQTAEGHGCDFLLMGGYGFRPWLEVVLGSTVDQVLRWRRWPVLVVR
jgi:nucleotide-binding universal stress UspA family protein